MATLNINSASIGPGVTNYVIGIIWDADGKRWAESLPMDSTADYATVWSAIESRKAEVDEQINSTFEITCQDGTVLTWP